MKTNFLYAAFGLALIFTNPARSQTLAVDNFSFENPNVGTGYAILSGTTTDNWIYSTTQSGVQNILNDGFTSIGTGDGAQDGWINLFDGVQSGTITSTDSFTLVAGTSYVLTVAVGQRDDSGASGNGILSLIDTTSNLTLASTTVTPDELTVGTFTNFSVALNAAESDLHAGDSFTIQLEEDSTSSDFQQGNFDNVRLSASSVPEPGTWALMGIGALVLTGSLRRKSRA
jgi:hypothetical protein